MDAGDHLTTLLTEGRLFARGVERAVERAGWDADVPPCPGWSVRDLVVHLGGVHRWVTAFVTEERSEPTTREERAAFGEHPDDRHLADWFTAGFEGVADAIARADPGLRCWTLWSGVPPRAFWARRMMHETFVHRLDAESAAGVTPTRTEPAVAADGVAELVDFLPVRARRRLTAEPARTVVLATTDTDEAWALTISPDGPDATPPERSAADLTLSGTAVDLHRTVWNRDGGTAAGVTADGDRAVLELWRSGARI